MIASSAANVLLRFDVAPFGKSLIESGEVTEVDWRLTEEVARRNGVTILRALLDLGLLGEDVLADRLSQWSGCARWDSSAERAPISDQAPRQFMTSNAALLLAPPDDAPSDEAPALRLICADPSDRRLWRSLLNQLGERVEVQFGAEKDIVAYLVERQLEETRSQAEPDEAIDVTEEISHLRDMASEAPVIRFFNQTIERAMELGASDVHLERFDHHVSLRMRVDGLLVDQPPPPPRLFDPLLCRIKIMGSMDIAERRLPQDGRIRMRLRGSMVDLRVSLVPTMYGQDAAIRLQDRRKLADVDLLSLGFFQKQIETVVRSASRSHGIVLVTGPTGSGKTTTLYALLKRLVRTERKVVTVEDPVEYAMDNVNQIQINPAIGLSFGVTLRHILRHDPDVVLIGEIRDQETAEMAFQAALTGHMVLSTLHTNDVPGTFVRLIDMGVEPYLVNAVVEMITAQRLLRKLCSTCRNEPEKRDGCTTCGGIGYRGRVAIMECSGLSHEIKQVILDGGDEHRLREALLRESYLPMRRAARTLVEQGVTDREEVARVLGAGATAEEQV